MPLSCDGSVQSDLVAQIFVLALLNLHRFVVYRSCSTRHISLPRVPTDSGKCLLKCSQHECGSKGRATPLPNRDLVSRSVSLPCCSYHIVHSPPATKLQLYHTPGPENLVLFSEGTQFCAGQPQLSAEIDAALTNISRMFC